MFAETDEFKGTCLNLLSKNMDPKDYKGCKLQFINFGKSKKIAENGVADAIQKSTNGINFVSRNNQLGES